MTTQFDNQANHESYTACDAEILLLWDEVLLDTRRLHGDAALWCSPSPTPGALHIPGMPRTRLVSTARGAITVHPCPDIKTAVKDAHGTSRDAGKGPITLLASERAILRTGQLTVVVKPISPPTRAAPPPASRGDFTYPKLLASALIVQCGLLAAFFITPRFPAPSDEVLFTQSVAFAAAKPTPRTKPEKPKPKRVTHRSKRAPKQEGRFGTKQATAPDAARSRAAPVKRRKREQNMRLAQNTMDFLGLASPERGAGAVVLGTGVGAGLNEALGGLGGPRTASMSGAGGLATRGVGPGGGALDIGGIGGRATRGPGGPGHDGPGLGADLGERRAMRIRPGKVVHKGGLTRAQIARTMERHMSRVRYCYERALTRDPNLAGKLVMQWTIGPDGRVTTAKPTQNTVRDPAVGRCVTRILEHMAFPRPEGGGTVHIGSYPLVFSAT